MVQHEKWPSIDGFHIVKRDVPEHHAQFMKSPITYRAKVKLHGTNASVLYSGGKIYAQSRENVLTDSHDGSVTRFVGDIFRKVGIKANLGLLPRLKDNLGFGNWVQRNHRYFASIKPSEVRGVPIELPFVIHGEWCGKGILKKVAISQINRPVFVVFALQWGSVGDGSNNYPSMLMIDPEEIRKHLPRHPDIFVLPWYDREPTVVQIGDEASMAAAVEKWNAEVAAVSQCDPWVAHTFGIGGAGEGLVYYPQLTTEPWISRFAVRTLMFKAKGESHRVFKQKEAVQIDPEIAASITDFVDKALPLARLEQGVQEGSNGKFDPRLTAGFLAWIEKDVKKETQTELGASGLEWKQVVKPLQAKAREWYLERANK